MRDIIIKLYNFTELKPELQAKVLEYHRNINIDDSSWCEHIIDDWHVKLESLGFHGAVIQWSGFYSQGDGACFDATIDVDSFAGMMGSSLAKVYADEIWAIDMDIVSKGPCMYNHEKSRYLHCSLSGRNYKAITQPVRSVVAKDLEIFLQKAEQLRHKLCNLIYKDLQTDYEYLTSDAQVRECLISNEYEYRADGTLFIGV